MKPIYLLSLAFLLTACNQDVQTSPSLPAAPQPNATQPTEKQSVKSAQPSKALTASTAEAAPTCADVFADMQARGVPRVVPAKDATPSERVESLPFDVTQRVGDGRLATRDEAQGIVGVGHSAFAASCTGTLIGDRWVLTAAHCGMKLAEVDGKDVYQGGVADGWVFVGSTSKGVDASGRPRHGTFLCHPGFETNLQNDIALIHLDKPVTGEPPVALPARSDAPMAKRAVDTDMMVFGFGATSYDPATDTHTPSMALRTGIVKLDKPRCGNQPSKTFCSQTTGETAAPHVGLCRGDSGGPLFIDADGSGSLRQFGVNSFMDGGECGEANVVSGFTDVSRHLDWIAKVTGLPL